jgi:hypothetical protein
VEPIDYRALINDRKAKDRRRPVRHVICLDPELYAELEEAEQELREERAAAASGEDGGPRPDLRGGGLSPVAKAELRVAEIEKRIADVSIVGVFKVFTVEQQAERHDILQKRQDENPDRLNAVAVEESRQDILLTFDRFEGPGGARLDLTRDDLEQLISTWSHGELFGLSTRIQRASAGGVDAPKSVRSSLLNQHYAAT